MKSEKIIFICLLLFLPLYIYSVDFQLDENQDGKVDRWLKAGKAKNWLLYDINKNGKADEAVLYTSAKGIVYLIKSEEIDYSGDGKVDVRIKNSFKGKVFNQIIEIDSNNDGKADLKRYEENQVVVKQLVDGNYNGRFETTEYYKAGIKVKEGIDTNEDGKEDDFYYYNGNLLLSEELDTNYDNKPDMWVKFHYTTKGKIAKTTIYKDNNYDGKPDEWHYTNDKRQVIRIERDTNFDGKVDKIENLGS